MQGRFPFEQAPGHLIRRAHQISVAVFTELMAEAGVTPVQFAILNVLMEEGGIDQVTLAARVAFDPATIGSVIGRLEKKAWLRRRAAEDDRRRKLLWLTDAGRQAVLAMVGGVDAVQQRILEPLEPAEKQQLTRLLAKLVTNHSRSGATG
ncbi:MAG: MarR family winged helix-turn-helix transcriptional regulator [Proteobacteria bacterium]|jgi:DNA-binding MarR family transcriptional regulator|nr:MarR family winged helix-turn-helix transcriptional regulator [Pseudomonadota bacterium]